MAARLSSCSAQCIAFFRSMKRVCLGEVSRYYYYPFYCIVPYLTPRLNISARPAARPSPRGKVLLKVLPT